MVGTMPVKYDRWYLKEILDLGQLKKIFKHFSLVTNMDVALFDFAGREILVERKANSVCSSAKNGPKCREYILMGSLFSSELGEPYICACGCGLIMCFSPVIYEERLIGSIACGPAVLWDADEIAVEEFLGKTKDMNIHVDIDKLFGSITSCTCSNMISSAQIIFMLVNSLTKSHSVYLNQRAQINGQQAKIAELIVSRKNAADSQQGKKARSGEHTYPFDKEKELIACVQNGNLEQSKKILNIFLGEIFYFSSGNLDTVKVRILELASFFSRSAMENGVLLPAINPVIVRLFNAIHGDIDFEKICFLAQQTMEEFIQLMNSNRRNKNISKYLSRAINYMAANYAEELTLKMVSDVAYISSFYLSHLFRKELNTTFSDHLCKIRIEKAKDFMKGNSDLRIQEIAEKTGFNDPNYFTKSFKELVGMTPREYKNFFK